LEVYITAFFPIPKSTSKKNRALMLEDKLLPTKKPDSDNIAKVICDALNGVAYGDDTQIVKLVVNKRYTAEEPKVIVYIDKFNW
jgi:Holliday junction resolvase RusA-like endonuclease